MPSKEASKEDYEHRAGMKEKKTKNVTAMKTGILILYQGSQFIEVFDV